MLRTFIYRWYERRLDAEVRRGVLPRHVAVLPDGNRRFARLAGMQSAGDGHRSGADTLERLVRWCDELAIPVVTLWVLSTDNLQRPAAGGEGPPLVCMPPLPFSHAEAGWRVPALRRWYERLARGCRLVQYDARGTGLSAHASDDFGMP